MPELDRIELTFTEDRATTRAILFEENLGEQEWSKKGRAVGSLYVMKEALELIGSPKKLKVTIEPLGGE